MAGRAPTLDKAGCQAIGANWTARCKAFGKALRRSRRHMGHEEVHALRRQARECLPVFTLLAAFEPGDPTWRAARHALKDLLHALGPLRDAHVRREQMKGRQGAHARSLRARARAAGRAARPVAMAVIGMWRDLPVKHVRRAVDLRGPRDRAQFARVIRNELAAARKVASLRWSQARSGGAEAMHAARLALRAYRYLLMATTPLLSRPERERIRRLEEWQDRIGRSHDELLLRAWLKAAGKDGAVELKRLARRSGRASSWPARAPTH